MNPKQQKLIEEAYQELLHKSHKDIEVETCYKWAGRAVAAYIMISRTEIPKKQLQLLADAEDYFKESVEHAATSLEPSLVEEIIQWVQPFKENANLFLLNS
jgi:hypothetical protein